MGMVGRCRSGIWAQNSEAVKKYPVGKLLITANLYHDDFCKIRWITLRRFLILRAQARIIGVIRTFRHYRYFVDGSENIHF